MKYLYLIFTIYFSKIYLGFASIQSDMKPNAETIMWNSNSISWWTWVLMWALSPIKNIILSVLAINVVWVFIYLCYKLVAAEWKPDEFKKAMLGFVYAIIWLAIIPLAWALVKLISSLQF